MSLQLSKKKNLKQISLRTADPFLDWRHLGILLSWRHLNTSSNRRDLGVSSMIAPLAVWEWTLTTALEVPQVPLAWTVELLPLALTQLGLISASAFDTTMLITSMVTSASMASTSKLEAI